MTEGVTRELADEDIDRVINEGKPHDKDGFDITNNE